MPTTNRELSPNLPSKKKLSTAVAGEVPAGGTKEPSTESSSQSLEQPPKRSRRRKTAHLKLVPETKEFRENLRQKCREVVDRLDKSNPMTKDELEALSRELLTQEGLGEGYVGWVMVILASEFWHDQVAHVPPSRRLFLLPHCLKHAEGCPADYDDFGLDCESCGACSIADFRGMAEKMGYKVLVAEGSPIVLKIIVSGHVDAIVGVACLNVLEKAIDKIMLAGIPCLAVPLLSDDCRNTSVDNDWVNEAITVKPKEPVSSTRSYVHLLRLAHEIFQPHALETLLPRLRKNSSNESLLAGNNGSDRSVVSPMAMTEELAYDFLTKGGKYSRPFITLAVYDALTGGEGTTAQGAAWTETVGEGIKRVAMAIEIFHKASLIHDDIEDSDEYRYGEKSLHEVHGVPAAINVGDYMVGLGYRAVSQNIGELGGEVTSHVLDSLALAHLKLSEGQGAELFWRDGLPKDQGVLTPLEALKIYALKTAPAFEAALFSGVYLSGVDVKPLEKPLKLFARNMGVAFQILNDLKDWQQDEGNKLKSGGDLLGKRPTVLWALALEGLDEKDREALIDLMHDDTKEESYRLREIERFYRQANVFSIAEQLVEKHRTKAEELVESIENDHLCRLLGYLLDTVLELPAASTATLVELRLQGSSATHLPIVSK